MKCINVFYDVESLDSVVSTLMVDNFLAGGYDYMIERPMIKGVSYDKEIETLSNRNYDIVLIIKSDITETAVNKISDKITEFHPIIENNGIIPCVETVGKFLMESGICYVSNDRNTIIRNARIIYGYLSLDDGISLNFIHEALTSAYRLQDGLYINEIARNLEKSSKSKIKTKTVYLINYNESDIQDYEAKLIVLSTANCVDGNFVVVKDIDKFDGKFDVKDYIYVLHPSDYVMRRLLELVDFRNCQHGGNISLYGTPEDLTKDDIEKLREKFYDKDCSICDFTSRDNSYGSLIDNYYVVPDSNIKGIVAKEDLKNFDLKLRDFTKDFTEATGYISFYTESTGSRKIARKLFEHFTNNIDHNNIYEFYSYVKTLIDAELIPDINTSNLVMEFDNPGALGIVCNNKYIGDFTFDEQAGYDGRYDTFYFDITSYFGRIETYLYTFIEGKGMTKYYVNKIRAQYINDKLYLIVE